MNKQIKHPSLFEQALAIAIKEGKVESSKDTAPFQSGIVGENYLLFSKQRKLLISVPLEKLKRNKRKVSKTNKVQGCFVNSLLITAVLAFLTVIASPRFFNEQAKREAAKNTLATIAKVCSAKMVVTGTGSTIVPALQGYISRKRNIAGFYLGNNLKASGTSIPCPTTGEMKFVSEDESKYPSFSYNVGTGKKTCIAKSGSDAEKRGCINGEW